MSALLQDSPPVLEAYKEFQHFSSDKAAQDWLRWRERFLEEQRMGFAEVWEGGLEKGRAEGRTAGLTEGEAKGEATSKNDLDYFQNDS